MKTAIIVQRYGLQINGGAELHARQLAEHLLLKKHKVSVFTTKSISYVEWGDQIEHHFEKINGIEVYRFSSDRRKKKISRWYYRLLRAYSKIPKRLRKLGLDSFADSNLFLLSKPFSKWLQYQGPYCPGLLDKIEEVKNDYDIFIFFTYLYYPTNAALFAVKEKSIFIPTAHNEVPFYFSNYKRMFEETKFIMYNSYSEKKLVETTYPKTKHTKSDIAGVGVDMPEFVINDSPLKKDYFIYIGRIDRSKNVHELVDWFKGYAEDRDIYLVLVGKNDYQDFKSSDKIIFTGFVSDQEKNNWLHHSKALIIPSKFESLSMVTIEAMNMGIPVIANAHCDVLSDHIKVSKAGFTYENADQFEKVLDMVMNLSVRERKILSKNGKKYVADNYKWDKVLEKFEKAFQYIKKTTETNRERQQSNQ